ncbi:MFS transporter [Bartonella rattaustraliani]|uniref:MFS transporter n=1 Tax=Bartonella rattaustraliani TaxID=481139 RepID=UPI000317891E|nr:MFS transporter [Bartonella rattaustraliani]
MYYLGYGLFVAIVGFALCILFTGSVLRFIIPAVAVISGEGEIFTSFLFSLMAVGTIIGGFVYAWFIKRRSPPKLMWLWFLYGFFILTMSVSTFFSLYFLLPLSFLLGICGAWVYITLVTIIQSHSQKENIGKNFGAFSTFANSAEAISGLVSGGLAAIGLIVSFIVMTSLIVLTGLMGALLLSRNTGKVQRENGAFRRMTLATIINLAVH